ncbi:MAG: DUF1572 family protein, partial [Candidatus Zixiibacteriota bacterium]
PKVTWPKTPDGKIDMYTRPLDLESLLKKVDNMVGKAFFDDSLLQLRKYKKMGEDAITQISEKDFFVLLDKDANNIALIVKHMAGNMRSRWTDFLTSDGEKPNRNRDAEFEVFEDDSKKSLMRRWEDGWKLVFNAIEPLKEQDLLKTIHIRSEPHSVMQAINRQLTHYAYHVGQIVFLAKHFAGPKWKSLSIPKGKSKSFEVSMRGEILKMAKARRKSQKKPNR